MASVVAYNYSTIAIQLTIARTLAIVHMCEVIAITILMWINSYSSLAIAIASDVATA